MRHSTLPSARTRSSQCTRLLTLCMLASIGFTACNRKKETPTPPTPEAPTTTPLQREVTTFDEYTGRFAAIQSVDVRARVAGYLEKITFKEGQFVKAGDLLFVIDQRPFQAAEDAAKAQVEVSEAALELAKLELTRVKTMFTSSAASQADVDRKTAALTEAQAQLEASKANLQTAQLNLEFTTITAPVDGITSKANVTIGNLITGGAGGGNVLTSIVSIDPIYLYFNADEGSVLRYMKLDRSEAAAAAADSEKPANEITPDDKVRPERKAPIYAQLSNEKDFPHSGVIDFVDNQIDQSTGTLLIRGNFQNPGMQPDFLPGMFAKVRIPFGQAHPALLIPQTAVGADQNQRYVYTVGEDNKVTYHPVKLGAIFGEWQVVLTDGVKPEDQLKPTDRIVSRGLIRLRPDQLVKPIPDTELPDPPTGLGVKPETPAAPGAPTPDASTAPPAEPAKADATETPAAGN